MFHVLRSEQELYIREGLEWSRIDYFDNESICELIDKPSYGILSLINEPHLNSNDALLFASSAMLCGASQLYDHRQQFHVLSVCN